MSPTTYWTQQRVATKVHLQELTALNHPFCNLPQEVMHVWLPKIQDTATHPLHPPCSLPGVNAL